MTDTLPRDLRTRYELRARPAATRRNAHIDSPEHGRRAARRHSPLSVSPMRIVLPLRAVRRVATTATVAVTPDAETETESTGSSTLVLPPHENQVAEALATDTAMTPSSPVQFASMPTLAEPLGVAPEPVAELVVVVAPPTHAVELAGQELVAEPAPTPLPLQVSATELVPAPPLSDPPVTVAAATTTDTAAVVPDVISAPPALPPPPILPPPSMPSKTTATTNGVSSGSAVSSTISRAKQLIERAMGWVIDSPPALPPIAAFSSSSKQQQQQFMSVAVMPRGNHYLRYEVLPHPPCAACNVPGAYSTRLFFFCDGTAMSLCGECAERSNGLHTPPSWDVLNRCYAVMSAPMDKTRALHFRWQQ